MINYGAAWFGKFVLTSTIRRVRTQRPSEVVDNLQKIVSSMDVKSRSENRVQHESEKHQGAVRLQWDGEAKKWLLTTFEKDAGGDTNPRTDTADANGQDGSPERAPEDNIDQRIKKFYQNQPDPSTGTIRLQSGK